MEQHHAATKHMLHMAKDALRNLLPFLEATDGDAILARVEATPTNLLRRFYVFRVFSIAVPERVDDIQRFIERRYRTVLSAAHRGGWAVLTSIVGFEAGISVFLGFMAKDGTNDASYVFERRLRGLLRGLNVKHEDGDAETLITAGGGYRYGGLMAGIPALKVDDERQYLDLAAVLRAMYGQRYALMLLSRPMPHDDLQKQLQAVWRVQDECHKAARHTRQHGLGGSKSTHVTTSSTEGTASTEGTTSTRGISVIAATSIRHSVSRSHSESRQEMITKGRSTGTASELNFSENLSEEEQNSLFVELERIADHHGQRLLKAFNVGAWQTSITFATATMSGRDILAGLLLGELAKPSTFTILPHPYYAELTDDRPILLPQQDDGVSTVFPSSLASYLTSEELAALSAPPSEHLPGYEVRRFPTLSLTDEGKGAVGAKIRLGSICDYGQPVDGACMYLGQDDLTKHLFICGLTGSGKTTTVMRILAKVDVPFLVLEPAKRNYRRLLGCPSLRDRLHVLTPGDTSIASFSFNPFHFPAGVPAGVHIDHLMTIFNGSLSLYGPMPYIVERCLQAIYRKRGWDLVVGSHSRLHADGSSDAQTYREEERYYFPTLLDLRDEVASYVQARFERRELSNEICTAIIGRMNGLVVGTKGVVLNSSKPLDVKALLARPTVLELEALSDDDKAFVVGLLLTFISEYRQANDPSRMPYAKSDPTLNHVLVVEEAHRLLKNVVQDGQHEWLGNAGGRAAEIFANLISETGSMGQGVVVVDQVPSKLLSNVIKNTNTKIVHRLVSRDEQMLLAPTLGLAERESLYLSSLQTGHALCAKAGMQRPIEVKVWWSGPWTRIGDEKISGRETDVAEEAGATAIRSAFGSEGDTLAVRLLCTLACGVPSDAMVYTEEARARVRALLLQQHRSSSESSIGEFLAIGVVALLVNGIFRLADGEVYGMTSIIRCLLDGDEAASSSFKQRLARGWSVANACDGVICRIRELALDRGLRAGISRGDNGTVNRIVGTYFIGRLSNVQHTITSQILAALGGVVWSPVATAPAIIEAAGASGTTPTRNALETDTSKGLQSTVEVREAIIGENGLAQQVDSIKSESIQAVSARNEAKLGGLPRIEINRISGATREAAVRDELVSEYPAEAGYHIEEQCDLRDVAGKKVKDEATNEGRRIDFAIIKDGEIVKSVEVTRESTSNAAQTAREMRILAVGGNVIRDHKSGELVPFASGVSTEIVRRA